MQLENLELAQEPAANTALESDQPIKTNRRKRLIAVAAIPAVVATVGLAYFAGTQSGGTQDSSDAEPTAAESAAAAQGEEAPALDWDKVVAFNKAMDANDLDSLRSMVSPGSPAERWFTFYDTLVATSVAAGIPMPADDSSAVYDEPAGTVTTTYPDGTTTVTKDYLTDEEGRIVSWSDAAGVPIGDRLWTANASGTGAGQTVTITGAFLNSSGNLIITADVTGTAGSDIDWSPTYVGADGVAREPVYWEGPSGVTPDAVSKVQYTYEGASFGGRFVYEAWNSNTYANSDITLTIS